MKQLFIIFLLTGLLASCKKNNSILAEPAMKYGKLSELMYSFNNGPAQAYKMTYDNSGRFLTFFDDDHRYSFSYTAPSSLVVTRTKLSDGAVDQLIDCVLNVAGAITKMEYKENGSVIHTYLFTYDASGNLKTMKGIGSGNVYEKEFVYENGVMISSKALVNGALSKTYQYSYDHSKPNKTGITYWYIWPSDILHGKSLKYHMTEIKEFDANCTLTNHRKNIVDYNSEGYAITDDSVTNKQLKSGIQL